VIWLSWRQFRTQALVTFGALAALGFVLAVTGPHLLQLYNENVAHCQAHGNCQTEIPEFMNLYHRESILNPAVWVVPALIGMFWGAPLVARELETGTHRLAWTQSVTRTRWLAVKLAVVGLASVAVAGLLSLMVTWWFSPIDRVNMYQYATFDQRDLTPVGYAAFAFAVGVTAGVLIRRTLPAMAATLVAFVATRLAVADWVRPNLVAPLRRTFALDRSAMGFGSLGSGQTTLQPGTPNIPNAWIYSTRVVDGSGHALPSQLVAKVCPTLGTAPSPANPPLPGPGRVVRTGVPPDVQSAMRQCVDRLAGTYHEVVSYQPGSRYWVFQWSETAIFVTAAAALVGLCFWWIHHRLT
jgi:hypothetical protein